MFFLTQSHPDSDNISRLSRGEHFSPSESIKVKLKVGYMQLINKFKISFIIFMSFASALYAETITHLDITPGAKGSAAIPVGRIGNLSIVSIGRSNNSKLAAHDGVSTIFLTPPGVKARLSHGIAQIGSKLIFAAKTSTTGIEPWVTDGTRGGTNRLRDIIPGKLGSYPRKFITAGEYVYFLGSNRGNSIWRTKGSASSTRKVSTTLASFHLYRSEPFVIVNNSLYFIQTTGPALNRKATVIKQSLIDDSQERIFELESSGGVYSMNPSLKVLNNKILILSAKKYVGPGLDRFILTSSDGTRGGTQVIGEGEAMFPIEEPELEFNPHNIITLFNNKAYFVGGENQEPVIFETDGTRAGTRVVIRNSRDAANSGNHITSVRAVGTSLIITRNILSDRPFLVSDGTQGGTLEFNSSFAKEIAQSIEFGGSNYFSSNYGRDDFINIIYKITGNVNSVTPLTTNYVRFNPRMANSRENSYAVVANENELLLQAGASGIGTELFILKK